MLSVTRKNLQDDASSAEAQQRRIRFLQRELVKASCNPLDNAEIKICVLRDAIKKERSKLAAKQTAIH